MEKTGRLLEWICAVFSGLSLVGLVIVTLGRAVAQQLGLDLPGEGTLAGPLVCLFLFASVPLLVRENGHIRVGLVTEVFGPRALRVESLLTALIECLATLLLTWMVYLFAGQVALDGLAPQGLADRLPGAPVLYLAAALLLLAVFFVLDWYLERLPRRGGQG